MADGVIGWDAVLEGHLAAEQCKVLASARIGMAGAGGLGSNCAVFLARTGIRDFVIADPDVVALSNLNRQHFFPRHLGLPKVEALGTVLRELNPSVILRLEPRALDGPSACALFAGCDIVVEAVDDPEVKKNLVEALLLAGHRVVSASGMAGWGGVPMTARKLGSRLVVVGDHVSGIGPGMPPLAPRRRHGRRYGGRCRSGNVAGRVSLKHWEREERFSEGRFSLFSPTPISPFP